MFIIHVPLELRVFKNCYLETSLDDDNVRRDYYKGFWIWAEFLIHRKNINVKVENMKKKGTLTARISEIYSAFFIQITYIF